MWLRPLDAVRPHGHVHTGSGQQDLAGSLLGEVTHPTPTQEDVTAQVPLRRGSHAGSLPGGR